MNDKTVSGFDERGVVELNAEDINEVGGAVAPVLAGVGLFIVTAFAFNAYLNQQK